VVTGTYTLLCVEGRQRVARGSFGAAAAYVLLFLLGAMEGLIGSFQFSRSIGSVPVAALGFCALILATCLLAGAGMSSPLGGLAPAAGWLAATFVLTLPTSTGSVIVTNTSAGRWYLYGGAVCAGVGVALGFRWRRPRPPGRDRRRELGS
jgi:Family of unknown function (DUF6113)